jgi:N-acetylmuramoyl-L-alanine amidase
VEELCSALLSRYRIPLHRVVGHSDIAPDRKSDPGELFDWSRLARAGVGIWPEPATDLARGRGHGIGVVARAGALADLAGIGYCVTAGAESIGVAAFQRRFRPERWDGRLDAETAWRLAEVRTAYDRARQR